MSLPLHVLAISWLLWVVVTDGIATFGNASASPSSGISDFNSTQTLSSPFPYEFPNLDITGAESFPMAQCDDLVIEEATVDELQDAMAKGQLTSETLVNCYLQRIYQTDGYIK